MRHESFDTLSELFATWKQGEGSPRDFPSTFQHIAETAQKLFAADGCVMLSLHPITGKLNGAPAVVGDVPPESIARLQELKPGGLTHQVLNQGIVVVTDVEKKPEYQRTFPRQERTRSFVALPLQTKYRQKPFGVLYITSKRSRRFNADDRSLFQLFADQASFLLQEAWLSHRFQEVAKIGQEINDELSTIDDLFQKLRERISTILDTTHAFFLAGYQPQTNTLNMYVEDEGKIFVKENDPLEGASEYVITTKKTLFIEAMSRQAPYVPYQRAPIKTESGPKESHIFVPLLFREVAMGVLSIQHPQPYAYDQEDLFILQLLANHIALALNNMRLYDNLSRLNEAGQVLTQQLDSAQVLQATADKIQEATKADNVVLYPYNPIAQQFIVPPRIGGEVRATHLEWMSPTRPDDMAGLTLKHANPIFAKESSGLYTALHGDRSIRQGNFQERENISSAAALPLRVGEVSVGVLFVNFRQTQRFDASQRLFIEGLAHYAAIAIKNAQKYESLLSRRLQELETLQAIDNELKRNLDLETVLQTLLAKALEQVHADEGAISFYNPQTQMLEDKVIQQGHDTRVREKLRIPLPEIKGIIRWVLENKKPARVSNVHRDAPWKDFYYQAIDDTVSELDVPLLDGEEVVGLFNFESTKEGFFGPEDEDFLRTLAGQAILAIKNAQAYEREKRLAEEQQALNEISKEIIGQLDTKHLFEVILDKALRLTNSSTGVLMLYSAKGNDLEMVAERGVVEERKGERLRLNEGVVGYVATHKRLLNVDPSQPPWNKIYLNYILGTRSELAVPMLARDELVGILNVESSTPDNFDENDERLLKALADLAVVALQQANAYEQEKRLAEEQQVLNEISKEIIGQLALSDVFKLILEKALLLTSSTTGTLELFDPKRNELEMVAERGVVEGRKGERLGLDEGVVGKVATTRRPLNVDPSQPPWNEIYLDYIPGTRSELAVPMLARDMLRGVLNIESPVPEKFTEKDERLLQALADLAVIALQNAERYEKEEEAAQRFALLYRAGEELSAVTESAQLGQAYEIILTIAEQQSRSQITIRRVDEESQELVLKLASQHQKSPLFPRMKLTEGLNGQVAREQHTIVVEDTANPPPGVEIQLSDPATRSVVIIPIKFKDRYYGNLGLAHEKPGYFRSADISLYEGLAQQLAGTIYRLEITDERQVFEQRALSAEEMSSIGQSAFEITHRLANDLGLVPSFVEDIEVTLAGEGIKNSYIHGKLESIAKAVRLVLVLSRSVKEELGRFGAAEEAAGEPVSMHPDQLLQKARKAVPLPASIQIEVDCDADVAFVRVNPGLVDDILRNLITNAVQAMPMGGKITLRAHNAGRAVAIEVIDTGIGIPEEKQGKIFDLFYSTRGSSGFGLWSARHSALRMGGNLTVTSIPGQGATFTLLLPRSDQVKKQP